MSSNDGVPFFSAAGAALGVDLAAVAAGVLASGRYVLGPEVEDFEAEFARYIGVHHAVGLASGTDALVLALRALGVRAGHQVAIVANAGCYASTALAQVGAQPRYVDVDPATLNMDPHALGQALQDRAVVAVIATHLYGKMADMRAIGAVCRERGAALIEDCAQAHGAMLFGRRAGAWGNLACFSFYPTKNLGAAGDGGAIVTNDAALSRRVRCLRQYGWLQRYEVAMAGGINSRLDELQAALLRAKLPRLDAANDQRRAMAARYQQALAGLPLKLPPNPGDDNVAHLYVVRTPQRDALQQYLQQQGIASAVHYAQPDHRQPVRRELDIHLPATENACSQVLSLPCFPGLQEAQQQRVIDAVHSFFGAGG